MRTLHINTEKGWRGGESQTLYLAEGLKSNNHDAIIVARPESALIKKSGTSGLKVIPVRMRSEFDILAIYNIARIMRQESIEICHMHTPHSVTLGSAASRIAGVPVTVVSRRVDFSIRKNPLRKIKYQWGINRIIAISKGVRNILVADGISQDMITIIYEGVNIKHSEPQIKRENILAEFEIEKSAPIVGNIAHFTDHKGHRYLLDSIPIILERFPKTRFIILGNGELECELKAQARRLKIEKELIFAGFRKEVIAFLNVFDIFVISSHLEGLCTSILDAMAAGLPVVASRVGGIPELVENNETGVLVPPKDPKSLAEAIIDMIGNKEKRKKMGEKGKERVKEFSSERMVLETLKLYRELLAEVNLSYRNFHF